MKIAELNTALESEQGKRATQERRATRNIFDIANFNQTANNPKSWKIHAEALHLAAAILREKANSMSFKPKSALTEPFEAHRYGGVIFISSMLQGLAIETFLKAFWIMRGNAVSQNGKYEIQTIKPDAHDLTVIAGGVGFSLSAAERKVLARLSLFVSSYGRYPITKNWKQNPMRKNKQGILQRLSWDKKDHETAEAVIRRLKKETATPPNI